MLARFRRLLNRFFSQSSTINNEPLNRVSLIVIILIDIFILVNVFTGLDDIGRWHLSPSQAYPCYAEWKDYRTQTTQDKDYEILQRSLPDDFRGQPGFQQTYQQTGQGHLGSISATCLNYAAAKDQLNTAENQQRLKVITQKQTKINALEQANRTIRAQYDSTLLEKIAGQSRDQSINAVEAEKAKQTLEQNNRTIATLKSDVADLKKELLAKPESAAFIATLQNDEQFKTVEAGYQQADFWYPSIQFVFQALFLLPLLLAAFVVNKFAQRKGYGLVALISWHLLVIFFIPLIFKVFEFLQVGVLFQFFVNVLTTLLSGLLFLVSYLYILLIPLIGFGIIKFFQRIVFNPKGQAATRVQRSRCIRCAKSIRHHDHYCPHCGYDQYMECQNCHELTYKHLPHCKQCGHVQAFDQV
ncbi:zinc ribbon domain-containing protein [Stenomitos frigidus]|uniref:Zinc ribbon domain-containing protein n=1 Tax=Stenomitos frigidus ULC18 TaxID=2107698 RepID=A0A2T1EG86_9CYAN|nr:zinc ribbon domain-containing protein [Stenomitos frigidus]PSB31746.1 hypothetical protein C7B82_07000 [Stenomitos frigidus ULC18]